MLFFGPKPWGAAVEDLEHFTTNPVANCGHCEEPIAPLDYGVTMPLVASDHVTLIHFHRECEMRLIFGSVGHQLKECGCFGGNMEDPPHMTPREAARAAVELFENKQRKERRQA